MTYLSFCLYSATSSQFASEIDKKGFIVTPRGVKRKFSQVRASPPNIDTVSNRHIGSTPGFTAPELLVPNQEHFLINRNSLACDMFAVGMSVLCFLVKSFVYHQNNLVYKSRKTEREEIKRIVQPAVINDKIRKTWSPDEYNELKTLGLIELVYKCLEHNPANRITAEEAIKLLSK
jgi:serine/threonine protein kinase